MSADFDPAAFVDRVMQAAAAVLEQMPSRSREDLVLITGRGTLARIAAHLVEIGARPTSERGDYPPGPPTLGDVRVMERRGIPVGHVLVMDREDAARVFGPIPGTQVQL